MINFKTLILQLFPLPILIKLGIEAKSFSDAFGINSIVLLSYFLFNYILDNGFFDILYVGKNKLMSVHTKEPEIERPTNLTEYREYKFNNPKKRSKTILLSILISSILSFVFYYFAI